MKWVVAPVAPALEASLRRPLPGQRGKASLSFDACNATHAPVAAGPSEFDESGRVRMRPAASPTT